MLNKRGFMILNDLVEAEKERPVEKLVKKYGVSSRTIRNDLDLIDQYLLEAGFQALVRKSKVGIRVNEIDKDGIRERIFESEGFLHLMNAEDRLAYVSKLLLLQERFFVIDELVEALGVSKSTVVKDLDQLKKMLTTYQLVLETSNKNGIRIVGDEFNKRQLILDRIIRFQVDVENKEEIYHKFFVRKGYLSRDFLSLTSSYDSFSKVEVIVKRIEEGLNYKFSDKSFYKLVLYILLFVNRVHTGHRLMLPQAKKNDLAMLPEYLLAFEICSVLENDFDLEFSIDEICGLCMQISGGKASKSILKLKENYADLQVLTFDFIEKVSRLTKIKFSSDIQLFNHLLFHLKPALFRIQHGIRFENPLLQEIKEKYKWLFESVRQCITSVEAYAGNSITEDEIGYLTLHFAALIYRQNEMPYKRPKVCVVCNYGIGTMNLLASRLETLYDLEIACVSTLNELEETLDRIEIDMVISTLPIHHILVKTVQVSALLTEQDIQNLDKIFLRKQNIDLEKLMDIINRNCEVVDPKQLITDLSTAFHVKTKMERMLLPMLKDVINVNMITLDYEAENWEDAVREAGNLLKKNGCIDQPYIESMVDTVRKMGPYIVIGKGIALPHSRSTDAVRKIGISMVRLAKPVEFGSDKNDPVDLVFGLCSTDNSSHLLALQGLAKKLNNSEYVEFLRNAEDLQAVLASLSMEEE